MSDKQQYTIVLLHTLRYIYNLTTVLTSHTLCYRYNLTTVHAYMCVCAFVKRSEDSSGMAACSNNDRPILTPDLGFRDTHQFRKADTRV
jgi:hypothetical protein